MSDLIDKTAAQAEIDALTINAKHYLADLLGNPLHVARFAAQLGRYADVDVAIEQLVQRINNIRLFTDAE